MIQGFLRRHARLISGLVDSFANSGLTFISGIIVARVLSVDEAADFFLLLSWSLIALGVVRAFYIVPLYQHIATNDKLGIEGFLVAGICAVVVVLALGQIGGGRSIPTLALLGLMLALIVKDTVRSALLLQARERLSAALAIVGVVLSVVCAIGILALQSQAEALPVMALLVAASTFPYLARGVGTTRWAPDLKVAQYTKAIGVGKWILLSSVAYAATDMMVPTIVASVLGDHQLVFYAGALTLSGLISPVYRYLFLRNLADIRPPSWASFAATTILHLLVFGIVALAYNLAYPPQTNFGWVLMGLVVGGTYLQNVNTLLDAYLNAHNQQKLLFVNLIASILLAAPILLLGVAFHNPELIFGFPAARTAVIIALNLRLSISRRIGTLAT